MPGASAKDMNSPTVHAAKRTTATSAVLRMEGITKEFAGVVANSDIDLELYEGEILALVGENGAGKSTLMKILYGLYSPDRGNISIRGDRVNIKGPREAIANGIGMVHQHFMLVPTFSVLENIILGAETSRFGILDYKKDREVVQELIDGNNLCVNSGQIVEELPVGLQQRVEILKTLYRGAEILIFDEPTSVLTPQETAELFKIFRLLCSQGKSIIFISHKLDEVLDIADRITVIRRGKVVETLQRSGATKAMIAQMMVGRPVLLNVQNPRLSAGKTVLEISGLSLVNSVRNRILHGVSLEVHEGEIYGIAGVEGNGQSELVNAIAYGADRLSGSIFLDGKNIVDLDVRRRRDVGMSHIPEDRRKYGVFLSYPLSDNLMLGVHHKKPYVNGAGIQDSKQIMVNAKKLIDEFDIRPHDMSLPAHALSGGNQQKVIIARELNSKPRLLLANQPTRGVDIGATEFIYNQLILAKTAGTAVLLVSADLDEIMSLSDRIGVMYKGRLVKEFDRTATTKEEVGFYMMGDNECRE